MVYNPMEQDIKHILDCGWQIIMFKDSVIKRYGHPEYMICCEKNGRRIMAHRGGDIVESIRLCREKISDDSRL